MWNPSKLGSLVLLVVVCATACSRTSADDYARNAKAFLEQGKINEAILAYRQAVQKAPERGDLHSQLADLYMRLPDFASALKEYVRAADALPKDVEAQVKAAGMLVRAHQFEDAQARARKALALAPTNAAALIIIGNALAGLKDFDGAVSEYQEALVLDPGMDVAHMNIATIQSSRGQGAEAEASFRKALEAAPASMLPRLALANFLWSSGRAPEAEQTLKEALAKNPTDISVMRALGMFYMATNRVKEAEPHFQAIAKNSDAPVAQLWLADYYLITRRYDDAKPILQRIAKTNAGYAVATTRLAALDAAAGARAQALLKLNEVTGKYPRDMSARLLTARLLLIDGKRDEALAKAQAIVNEDPTSPASGGAYLLIAGIQASLDRPDDAINAYQEVLRRGSQDFAANTGLVRLYLARGSLDQAEAAAQLALAIQPKSPEARALMVRVHLAQNKLARAKDELDQLHAEFPKSATVMNLLAAQQLANGSKAAARDMYAKAAAADTNDLEALAGLVRLDLAAGNSKEALARVDSGLKNPKVTGDFLALAAQVHATAGDAAKAEELLRKAIEIEPNRLQAYGLLGALYARQRRLDDAASQFREIVLRNPRSVPANTMLGLVLEAQKRGPEAEDQYKKVLAIDPQAAVAANNLAWIYVASDRHLDEALLMAQNAQKRLPDEPHVNDTLGWICYKKKMTASAIQYLSSSVRADPNDPATHYHLGMAYVQAGENQKARQELQRALDFKVEFEGAAEARRQLSEIAR